MTDNASPRPWAYIPSQPGRPIWRDEIIDADGEVLADTIGEADGLLIVAAVNAYDPTREAALETMREALEDAERVLIDVLEVQSYGDFLWEVKERTRKALDLIKEARKDTPTDAADAILTALSAAGLVVVPAKDASRYKAILNAISRERKG